jgi:hypothetical protein
MHQMQCLSHLLCSFMHMTRLFQHNFVMTRLMSMVRLQNSSPNKDNEADNSNRKAQIKTMKKKIHTFTLTAILFTTGDLQPRPASTQQDCHNPQRPKKQNKTQNTKTKKTTKNTRRKGNKSKHPPHPLRETTGRR